MSRLFAIAMFALFLAACGGKKGDAPAGDSAKATAGDNGATTTDATTSSAGATGKMFESKSGIIEMTNSMMSEMKQTLYFDDYGAKQAMYTTMEMEVAGQKVSTGSASINKDGYTITYDLKQKTGTKMKAMGGGLVAQGPSPSDMTDAQKKQYNFQELETREILGKQTKGYSMSAMGMDIKAWTWNNIPMHMEVGKEKPIVIKATKMEIDVPVPAEKFDVPADVKLTDM